MAAASNPYNLLLIKLVESFPNVYDQSLDSYRDNDARNKSWAIVTFNYNGRTKLNMNVSQVIAQWKKLESDYRNYRAELKKYIPSGSGQQSEPTPCPYYAEMGFLENKVDYRSTTTTHPYGKEIEIMGRYQEELPIPQRNEGNIFRHIQDEETSNRGANKENIPVEDPKLAEITEDILWDAWKKVCPNKKRQCVANVTDLVNSHISKRM